MDHFDRTSTLISPKDSPIAEQNVADEDAALAHLASLTSQVNKVLRDLALRRQQDEATGQFVAGNVGAGTTLRESEAFWSAVAHAKRELVQRVATDLAVDASTTTVLVGLIEGYAEARLFRTSMFHRLVELEGPVTTKGKARTLYKAYLAALDRETRLAQLLGLERRAKTVDLAQAFAEQERSRG